MTVLVIVFYFIKVNEFKEFTVAAITEHFEVKVINFIHFKAPNETYLHAESSMMPSAIYTNENSIINWDPLRVNFLALDTKIVHVGLHFSWILKISFLILQPSLGFGRWTKSLSFRCVQIVGEFQSMVRRRNYTLICFIILIFATRSLTMVVSGSSCSKIARLSLSFMCLIILGCVIRLVRIKSFINWFIPVIQKTNFCNWSPFLFIQLFLIILMRTLDIFVTTFTW